MARPSITIIFLFIFLSITTCSYSNNQTDFEALLAFKKSIHDDPLRALSSWNETTHFCSWNGVSCSKRHPNRVVSLSLRSQGLVGTLSPHIGNLSFLRTIILQNNTFRGAIPQEIGRLGRLEFIEFSNNTFGGGIPSNLSQCRNLHYLNLMDNKLTGAIFPGIGSLIKLKRLGLTENMLSGTIPPSIGNLTDLNTLSLGSCGLQGEIPESFAQLGRMQWLNLLNNNLTGFVPLGLYNLSSIEILNFSLNRFHGTIPSFTFPNLRYLSFAYNQFTGLLPPSLSNSSMLEQLGLTSNTFTGNMIDLTRFPSLQRFHASSNQFKGDIDTILSSLTNSTRLLVLVLSDNFFTGSLPNSIGNLSISLSILDIRELQLSGSIPYSIGNLVGLTMLLLSGLNLEGSIPSSIGELHNLHRIYLYENRLTNQIPSSIGNLSLLNDFRLNRNNLSESIPSSLGNCSNLLAFDLSENNLKGLIPPEIMSLSSLSIGLDLSNNILMGPIPTEVGSMRNLGFLDLSSNKLSGTIPTSLSSCVVLDTLHLGGNSLRGEIPNSLSSLRGLQFLDLSGNNLTGKIPRFLVEFNLSYLNISFNALQGEVPTLGVFQNGSAISVQGNLGLCGGIAILNLPSCSSPSSNKKDLKKVWFPTIAGAIGLVLLMCFFMIIYRRRTLNRVGNPADMSSMPGFLRLSYTDLLRATGGFLESNLLGAGRFGSVYRGTIIVDDNEERNIAVKVLNLDIRGAFKSLASECNALRGIRHRNLLKIVSVCDSIDFQGNDFKALVYGFMANGSLENWLHQNSEEDGRILSFIHRFDIAIDIAIAVEYLHSGTNSTVIHGDLKPNNILLDQDMVAHVGDFGLAKIITSISQNLASLEGSSSVAIKGTIGYIPPEYGMNNVVSTQGDAYSYGILLLEMFTNKRPTSDAFDGYVNIQDFVTNSLPDRATEAVDPFLHQELNRGGDKYWDCIVSIMTIGVRCSKEQPRDRMSMTEVVNELRRIRNVLVSRNVAP